MSELADGALVAGRYRVEQRLGSGGTAEVYRVLDRQLGRPVALKRLASSVAAGRGNLRAFEREYYTLTQLRHPNIVSAHDFGYDGAAPFYTMTLLEGDDLRDLAPLPWRRACEVMADVASALGLIHSRRLVHGDVTARNVRCAPGGRATLIDFGTMSTIGAPGELRGTPPHVAPELGTGQPVDERTDLYALGALAYWLLSGEHAYPVANLFELTAAWRRCPPPVGAVAEVPDGLGDLVMALLEPDPAARPDNAAAVLERVTALAGIAGREEPATARAYLASPPLIQRRGELDRLECALDAAAAGRGSAFVIDGEQGLGANRLLREWVLRAKTRGALVLSASSSAGVGAFGVARVLARQLLEGGGSAARRAAAPDLDVLGGLVPELGGGEAMAAQPLERHAQLAAALRDWLFTVAAERLVAVAVADLRACDDATLGWLAALAAGAPGAKLMLVATAGDDGRASPPLLAGVRQRCETLDLAPLDSDGTAVLVESMFGRVPHVERLAQSVYELCQGNPWQCLALVRHLADSGAVRYRDGAWSVPRDLVVRDVPSSLDAWLSSRVAALDGDARHLAEILAISRAALTVDDCVSLMDCAADAVFGAIHRLTMARIVVVAGARVSLAQAGLARALRSTMSDARCQDLHGRIGAALVSRGFDSEQCRLEAGYHLLRGGDPATGANLIADAATDTGLLASATGGEVVHALEAALAEYDRSGRQPRRQRVVLCALVRCAFLLDPSLVRYADRAVDALRRDAGIDAAEELAAAGQLPRVAALQRAVTDAARRCVDLPPAERGFDAFEAIQQLLLTSFSLMGVGINRLDIPAVQRVTRLIEPLAALGVPAAQVAHRFVLTVVDAMQGRQDRAQAGRHAFVEALSDPALFGAIPEDRRQSLIAAQIHGIGMLESLRGGEAGLRWAAELDRMKLAAFAPAAMQIRVLTYLFNGDEIRADACRAQLDVLALQRAPVWHLDEWILPYLAGPYDLWGDVVGLRHAVSQLRPVAAEHPGYEPFLRFALGAYHRERGELDVARAELETALRLAPPGEHVAWSPSIAAYVHTLVCARQFVRAIDEGERAMERSRADGLAELWVCGRVEPQLALARAHLGDFDAAATRLDAFIRASERESMPRPLLGKCYEARALVATLAGDRQAFVTAAGRAGACFRATGNSKLIAAHERLWKTAASVRRWRPARERAQSDIVTR